VGRVPPTCEFTACPIVTPTPSPIADWKTHTNTKLNFELKYPLLLREKDNNCQDYQGKWWCSFSLEVKDFYFILIANNPGSGGVIVANEAKSKISVGGITTNYTIGDEQEWGSNNSTGDKIIILDFLKDDNSYSLLFRFPNNSNVSANEKLAKQILSTFKFIKLAVTSLRPTSGPVGTNVTITGSGFTATGNKIKFGNLGSQDNPSYSLNSFDGRTLTFTVPLSDYYACWFSKSEVPPCTVPATSTQPGAYGVSVINANGTSNEILFTVTQ